MKQPRIVLPLVRVWPLGSTTAAKPEQLRLPFHPTLHTLMHSALAADSMMGHGFKAVEQRQAVFVSTTGKSKEQIIAESVPLLRKAGLLKE